MQDENNTLTKDQSHYHYQVKCFCRKKIQKQGIERQFFRK